MAGAVSPSGSAKARGGNATPESGETSSLGKGAFGGLLPSGAEGSMLGRASECDWSELKVKRFFNSV